MLSSILLSTVLAQSAYVSAQGIGPIGRPWGARAASAAAAVTWDNLGCFSDPSKARVLKGGYATTTTSASTTFCQNLCLGKGYSYTGTESGKECWCSNTFTGTTKSTACTAPCAGDSSQTCGGTYAVNVYSLSSSSRTNTVSTTTTSKASTTTKASTSTSKTSTTSKASSTTTKASSTTTKASTTTSKASTTSSKTGTSTSSSATSTSTNTPPSSGKVVIAHHIVGNSYQYTQATWASNIAMAQAAGIDGFALNIGSLDWQRARVADAYAAAKNVGFKLFLSFDMSAMPCASAADALAIRQYITDYATHPAQLFYKGKQVASTFSGSDCQFGQGSLNAGWQYAVKTGVPNPVAFIPSFFSDPSSFSQNTVQDGDFNWNGGWPMSSSDITFSSDQNHINSVPGKFYIAPVTPLFFTHYGPNTYNKNWIYRSDDNLYNTRWEELIQNRAQIDIVEIITWNDYGESHYIGPMGAETDQPMSQAWVDGFDHTAWATMTKYYADAWRNGAYPAITKNKIYISSRPAPKTATPSQSDSVGIPNNWQWTDDNIYAVVFSTGTYTLRLSIGSSSGSFPITAGVNKIKLPMAVGSPQATLVDSGGNTVLSFSPTFSVVANPPSYNFNYYIQASP